MSRVGWIAAAGIAAVALAGCTSSAATTGAGATTAGAATAGATTAGATAAKSPAKQVAERWEAFADGRARLVYLGGYTRNWDLVVDLAAGGQQIVRFTGDPILPGGDDAPTIAGFVGSEIFTKTGSGASTQTWTIFKLIGGKLWQVTSQGQPVQILVGGTVTHEAGFRCDATQFVTVSEGVDAPGSTTWTFQRDVYTWSGAELVPVSKQTGQTTATKVGVAPAPYTGVGCGDLPQYAPPYPS